MTFTGLADTYRKQEFVPKFDFLYNFERKTVLLNAGGPDKSKLALNLLRCLDDDLE
jgi:hypothetical protein